MRVRNTKARSKKMGKIYYLSYREGEGYFISEGEFIREPNLCKHRIDRDVTYHIVEDICPSWPLNAVQGIEHDTSMKTCDPRDYAGKCGVAELRTTCLHGGK